MLGSHLLVGLLVVWAVVTCLAVGLAIYRSMIGSRTEDRLYLDPAHSAEQHRHEEIVKEERKLAPYLYVLASVWLVLLVSILGVWIYRGLLMT